MNILRQVMPERQICRQGLNSCTVLLGLLLKEEGSIVVGTTRKSNESSAMAVCRLCPSPIVSLASRYLIGASRRAVSRHQPQNPFEQTCVESAQGKSASQGYGGSGAEKMYWG